MRLHYTSRATLSAQFFQSSESKRIAEQTVDVAGPQIMEIVGVARLVPPCAKEINDIDKELLFERIVQQIIYVTGPQGDR